ncbi:hypothetical protein [Alkalilimnicola ehrlichii]|uniref:Uncharacterized protein n=1 Tax=Alkalilimnicola ehrlichii TaxID=351052 RepID=A0A3E0WN56_9GAMM|nr:hypothetical protein [Alkalilimnicola ehrlichii]RFA34392.1 hypothetical protein CAL65_15230 [Alkalilimnicola ehrlichii]
MGFVVDRQSGELLAFTASQAILIVSLVGLAVSTGFAIAVWFGTHYLNNRKLAVRAVEKQLMAMGGVRVVNALPGVVHSKFQRVSPTVWVLRLIPVGFVSLWSLLALTTLLRLGQ